jgi:hypothetical protein
MEERREIVRTHIQRDVQIVISDRMPPITCTIRDMTNKGAGLYVATASIMPTTFAMSFDSWRSFRQCHLIWRTNKGVGIEFI